MGLKDKLRAQAEQALAKGKVAAEKGLEKSKEGLAQGQAKVKEMQDKRAEEKAAHEAGQTTPPNAPAGDYKLDDI
jgi:hypothetical protein